MPDIRVIEADKSLVPDKLKVAAYCRVSSDSDDQLNSFITQVDYYTKYIDKHPGWVLVDIYADEGLTGTKIARRHDFNRLMSDCRKSKIDLILVKSVSRFARNTVDCLKAVRELRQLGVTVEFEKEEINTSKIGSEMTISANGTLAQEESISISQNMRWSIRKRMEKGTFIAGSAPFGYRLIDGRLIVQKDEAEIVKYIYSLYLSGHGQRKISKMLNEDANTNKMRTWSVSAVEYVLTNEKYIGDTLLQKVYTTETLPFRVKKNNGELPKYYVERSHEAIISEAVYNEAQKVRANKKSQHKGGYKEFPFSRKIICECGTIYKRVVIRDKAYWSCRAKEFGEDGVHSVRIPEKALEKTFVLMLDKLYLHHRDILLPMMSQIERVKSEAKGTEKKIYLIDKKIAELNRQNLVLTDLKAKGYIDSADYLFQSEMITREVNKLRSERNKRLKDDDDDMLMQLNILLEIVQNMKKPTCEFDADVFAKTVSCIHANPYGWMTFHMVGGLELKERLAK